MRILTLLPRFREAQREMKRLEQRESWSRNEIRSYQLERINRVWKTAIVDVRYYREMAIERRLPKQFSTIEEYQALVPILNGDTLRSDPDRFLSCNAGRGKWYRSSGSTGSPLRVFREASAHREILAARYRFYQMYGLELHDRMTYVWGRAIGARGWWPRSCEATQDWLRSRSRVSAYHLDQNALTNNLKRISDFQPAGIYGFAQAVHLLAGQTQQQNFRCDSLKAIILTSEIVTPGIVRDVENAFGVAVTQEYGATECEQIAGEWPDRRMHVREDMVMVETIPCGDVHSLVLTVLNSSAFPLLRYEISDFCDSPLAWEDHGFAYLGRIAGRSNDMVWTKSGHAIHPSLLDKIVDSENADRIFRRYRVHQTVDGSLDVTVSLHEHKESQFSDTRLAAQISKVVEGFNVRVSVVPTIPLSQSGKHRIVRSDFRQPLNINQK